MHHYLHITDWFTELKESLRKLRLKADPNDRTMMTDTPTHVGLFVEDVEPDHLAGREPEDVAQDIFEGKHPRVHFTSQTV